MPRKKKTARDMTTEEAAKRLFPKKVRDYVKEIAREQERGKSPKNEPSQPNSTR